MQRTKIWYYISKILWKPRGAISCTRNLRRLLSAICGDFFRNLQRLVSCGDYTGTVHNSPLHAIAIERSLYITFAYSQIIFPSKLPWRVRASCVLYMCSLHKKLVSANCERVSANCVCAKLPHSASVKYGIITVLVRCHNYKYLISTTEAIITFFTSIKILQKHHVCFLFFHSCIGSFLRELYVLEDLTYIVYNCKNMTVVRYNVNNESSLDITIQCHPKILPHERSQCLLRLYINFRVYLHLQLEGY